MKKNWINLNVLIEILKRNKKKFERIVIGALVGIRINAISRTISDLRDERKGYNTSYVKKIETMAEEQISTNTKRAKEGPEIDVSGHRWNWTLKKFVPN